MTSATGRCVRGISEQIDDAVERRDQAREEGDAIIENAVGENGEERSFTDDERAKLKDAQTRMLQAQDEADRLKRQAGAIRGDGGEGPTGMRYRDSRGEERRALQIGDRLANEFRDRGDEPLSMAKFLRGVATGNWEGADAERRAMSEGVLADGGYAVPTPLSAQFIDAARDFSAAMRAGVQTVPMDSNTLRIARVDSDPTPAWKDENAAIANGDVGLGAVNFTARTLVVSTKMSVELAEDAANIDEIVTRSLGEAMGQELDRAILLGSGTAPEPRGIRNTVGIQTVDQAGARADYAMFSQAIQNLDEVNAMGDLAAIYAPRTSGVLDRLVDGDGQPLRPPESWKRLRTFTTNKIAIDEGAGTDETTAIVGDYAQALLGVRTSVIFEVSRVASDAWDNLQVAVRAYLRADIQLARASHFVLIDNIGP